MKRPKKYELGQLVGAIDNDVYRATDIDPLLDELERLKAEEIRNNTYPNKIGREAYRFSADGTFYCNPVKAEKKPFPSFDVFEKWYIREPITNYKQIYDYFTQFQYEKTVFPKVGDMVEGEDNEGDTFSGVLKWYELDNGHVICNNIRPVSTPTREEVIAQVESKLKSNKLIFDRELVEQFLNILKGQDDDL